MKSISRLVFFAANAMLMMFASGVNVYADHDGGPGQAGRVAYHYVGRVTLDFTKGTGVVVGYVTHVDTVPAAVSLFSGAPGESTAYLTFRANISFQPLAGNGDLGGGAFAVLPSLITPGEIKYYYSAAPSHTWSNPDTFSNGQLIATAARELEQFTIIGPISTNVSSAELLSGSRILFGGDVLDLRAVFGPGFTDVTTASNIPLTGSTATSSIFAFAGYATVNGR